MKNIAVKDGITKIERIISEEYILLSLYFFVLQRFIVNERMRSCSFVYVLILAFNFMGIR